MQRHLHADSPNESQSNSNEYAAPGQIILGVGVGTLENGVTIAHADKTRHKCTSDKRAHTHKTWATWQALRPE